MTIRLSDKSKKDLILIDPYYSQKQLSKALEISINKMMELRDEAGLEKKEKGRPVGTGMTFKGEEHTRPEEITKAKDRVRIEIKIIKLLTVYPDIDTEEGNIRQIKKDIIQNKLKDTDVEEQIQIIKDFKHEQSRVEEFINK